MPFNGSGGTTQPVGGSFPAVPITLIESAKVNISIADIYAMLSTCVLKDGQQNITQNIPMGGFRLTGLGAASLLTDAPQAGQVQNQAFTWCGTAGGTANAITLISSPAITAYAAGQTFVFKAAATNTGATTIQISAIATPPAAQNNGAALAGGEIVINLWYRFTLTSTTAGEIEEVAPRNGEYRSVQVFTASGTYTAPAGLKRVRITVLGGGGGGGGAANAAATSGGAGAGGGFSIRTVSAATVGASQTVTVGTGGTGGGAALDGAPGNTSSFGALCSATGGGQGLGAGGGATAVSGVGGIGSSGDLNGAGSPGISGVTAVNFGSTGGASLMGAGGEQRNGATLNGIAGRAYAGGGSGGLSTGGGTATGGTGANGVVFVEEFF